MQLFHYASNSFSPSLGLSLAQDCPIDISPPLRRDCYPWPGADQASCEARGCVWCPLETNTFPWCFPNDLMCPSTIPEEEREDCHPDPGASKETCLSRGCVLLTKHKIFEYDKLPSNLVSCCARFLLDTLSILGRVTDNNDFVITRK